MTSTLRMSKRDGGQEKKSTAIKRKPIQKFCIDTELQICSSRKSYCGNGKGSAFKLLSFVIAAFLTAGYVSADWYQLMLVQGSSMEPNYHDLQLVLLDKHSRDYSAGDVIAFRCDGLSAVLVKRIAAGQCASAQIIDGRLCVNGEESPAYKGVEFEYPGILADETRTGENEYIVIGDNVSASIDSRYAQVGTVSSRQIIGKVK